MCLALAGQLPEQDDLAGARDSTIRYLRHASGCPGDDHPDTLISKNNLGQMLAELVRWQEIRAGVGLAERGIGWWASGRLTKVRLRIIWQKRQIFAA